MEYKIEDPRILEIVERALENEIEPPEALAEMEELYGVSLIETHDFSDPLKIFEFTQELEQDGLSVEDYRKRRSIIAQAYVMIIDKRLDKIYAEIEEHSQIKESQ